MSKLTIFSLAFLGFICLSFNFAPSGALWSPTIGKYFESISQMPLSENTKDGFAIVRAAKERYLRERETMDKYQREAWELFISLERLEHECSSKAVKIVERNFEQFELEWPNTEPPKNQIEFVLIDIQEKQSKRCAPTYESILKGVDPEEPRPLFLVAKKDVVGEFGFHWTVWWSIKLV